MKKAAIWILLVVLIAGIAVAFFLWLNKPQVINVGNNTAITLLGAEYGKHHVFPKVENGRDVTPKSFDTTNDTLIVWVLEESKSNQSFDGGPLIFDGEE